MSKELDLNEIRDISLNILNNVTKFCDDNNIVYFLGCGTLLGAIRHKGFIPWDDDIDILMPRGDYERFLSIYQDRKYKVLKPSEGRYYYAKVYDTSTLKYESNIDYKKYRPVGVDIDVFPLDGSIDNKELVDKQYKKACFLETLLRLSNQPVFYRKNPIKCINRIIPRIIGSKRLVRLIENNAKKYPYETSNYVTRMRRSTNGFTGALPKEVYEVSKGTFEGNTYNIPKGYDKWLSTFYGNYMELPPENKRVVHITKCYKKDKQLLVLYKENKDNPKNSWSGTSYCLREALKKYVGVIFVDTNDNFLLRLIKKLSRAIGSVTDSKLIKPLYEYLHKKEIEYRIRKYPNAPVLEIAENVNLKNNFYLYRDMTYSCFKYVKDECTKYDRTYVHGMLRSISNKELNKRIKNENKLETRANASFYMGEWLAREMANLYPERSNKFIAVGGGINPEFNIEAKTKLSDNNTILFVGVDFYRKGGDFLVTAFKKLKEKYPNKYRLIIAGTNEYQSDDKDIIVTGKLNREELSKYFKEATLFCMPSRFEAYGLVFAEAKSYGLPIVAFKDYEMEYFVEDKVNGRLIEKEDTDDLCEALYEVLESKDIQINAMNAALESQKKYSWDRVAKDIVEVIFD